MSYNSYKILPPGISRKRKERESSYSFKPSASNPAPDTVNSNRLLAGYMAYEFLTHGTLLGQKFDPARVESVPLGGSLARTKPELAEPKKEQKSYAEVASILKAEGEHIPGIINPTQLARWIRM